MALVVHRGWFLCCYFETIILETYLRNSAGSRKGCNQRVGCVAEFHKKHFHKASVLQGTEWHCFATGELCISMFMLQTFCSCSDILV